MSSLEIAFPFDSRHKILIRITTPKEKKNPSRAQAAFAHTLNNASE
jgi:hypothetical protein